MPRLRLAQAGADPTKATAKGRTALQAAREKLAKVGEADERARYQAVVTALETPSAKASTAAPAPTAASPASFGFGAPAAAASASPASFGLGAPAVGSGSFTFGASTPAAAPTALGLFGSAGAPKDGKPKVSLSLPHGADGASPAPAPTTPAAGLGLFAPPGGTSAAPAAAITPLAGFGAAPAAAAAKPAVFGAPATASASPASFTFGGQATAVSASPAGFGFGASAAAASFKAAAPTAPALFGEPAKVTLAAAGTTAAGGSAPAFALGTLPAPTTPAALAPAPVPAAKHAAGAPTGGTPSTAAAPSQTLRRMASSSAAVAKPVEPALAPSPLASDLRKQLRGLPGGEEALQAAEPILCVLEVLERTAHGCDATIAKLQPLVSDAQKSTGDLVEAEGMAMTAQARLSALRSQVGGYHSALAQLERTCNSVLKPAVALLREDQVRLVSAGAPDLGRVPPADASRLATPVPH